MIHVTTLNRSFETSHNELFGVSWTWCDEDGTGVTRWVYYQCASLDELQYTLDTRVPDGDNVLFRVFAPQSFQLRKLKAYRKARARKNAVVLQSNEIPF